jgi:hypothetical protein
MSPDIRTYGTKRFPNPSDRPAVKTILSLRVNLFKAKTLRPETTTLANKKVVTPPVVEILSRSLKRLATATVKTDPRQGQE